jgi:hypothetical protein
VKEYDLYLPLRYNDGRAVGPDKLAAVKAALVEHFGGLTHFPQENEGLWRFGGITYRDQIVILRVLADDDAATRRFFAEFRGVLERELGQAEILIVERRVSLVR